jgi:hypothetical protein
MGLCSSTPPLDLTLGEEEGAGRPLRSGRVDRNGSKVGPSPAVSYRISYFLAALTYWPPLIGRPLLVGIDCC